jgi:protocatechuate 3,4-dioxygenase alpha subunit
VTEYVYEVSGTPPSPGPTPSQTVGPFFHIGLPYDAGPHMVGSARPGAFTLSGRVLDGAGDPVPDALVELWQADENGEFARTPGVYAEPAPDGFRGFARCPTDVDGRYWFRTVRPGPVPTADGRPQAPHLAMSVFARGMLRRAVTRVYFEEDGADPLLSSLGEDRRGTLVAAPAPDGYRFDVHLQGDDETVFLDGFVG